MSVRLAPALRHRRGEQAWPGTTVTGPVESLELDQARALIILAQLLREDTRRSRARSYGGTSPRVMSELAIELRVGGPVPIGVRRSVLTMADQLRREMDPPVTLTPVCNVPSALFEGRSMKSRSLLLSVLVLGGCALPQNPYANPRRQVHDFSKCPVPSWCTRSAFPHPYCERNNWVRWRRIVQPIRRRFAVRRRSVGHGHLALDPEL